MKNSQQESIYFDMITAHVRKRVTLSEQDEELFKSVLKIRHVLPRQYLLQQGDVCFYETYVCKGFLRSFHVDESGQENTLHFAMEDWWITDLRSFVRKEPATRNIIATEATTVLQLDLEQRNELIRKVPAFERFWRILFEEACIAAETRILNNIGMSGHQRYEALINKYPMIEQRLSQKHIASFLGITPVFLSQIRRDRLKQ